MKAGAETIFFAKQTDPADPANPSGCSNGIGYRHVNGPPEAPVLTATDPSSPAGDNFPNLIGTSPVQTTVSIYDNPSCAGAPLATGSASTFETQGIEVPVAANTTTTFHAKAKIAEYTSTCSTSSISYQRSAPSKNPLGRTPGGGNPGGGSTGGNPGTKVPDPKGKPPPPHCAPSPAMRPTTTPRP